MWYNVFGRGFDSLIGNKNRRRLEDKMSYERNYHKYLLVESTSSYAPPPPRELST
jgi:hypothetical protein